MRGVLHSIGAIVLAGTVALPAIAGEVVVFGNGFRLHADRHEIEGPAVRLYNSGGVTEMPAAAVLSFEREEFEPAQPPPPGAPSTVSAAPETFPVSPQDFAAQAANRFSLPEAFVRSVMRAESGFRQDAVSPKGALGLMQLMPDTARIMGVDPKDPRQNAAGGAQYLRELLVRYEDRPDQVLLALAAYNAGPAAVEKYHGVPPYRETREYILRVLKNWDESRNK